MNHTTNHTTATRTPETTLPVLSGMRATGRQRTIERSF